MLRHLGRGVAQPIELVDDFWNGDGITCHDVVESDHGDHPEDG